MITHTTQLGFTPSSVDMTFVQGINRLTVVNLTGQPSYRLTKGTLTVPFTYVELAGRPLAISDVIPETGSWTLSAGSLTALVNVVAL